MLHHIRLNWAYINLDLANKLDLAHSAPQGLSEGDSLTPRLDKQAGNSASNQGSK